MTRDGVGRRRILRAGGTLLTAGLAGCVGTDTSPSGTDTRPGGTTARPGDATAHSMDAELVGPEEAGGEGFGRSVATAGERVLVGAPGHDGGRGAAYVFAWTGGEWRRADRLTPPDGEGTNAFGRSVSMSGDWALVGAPGTGRGAGAPATRSGTSATRGNSSRYSRTVRPGPSALRSS